MRRQAAATIARPEAMGTRAPAASRPRHAVLVAVATLLALLATSPVSTAQEPPPSGPADSSPASARIEQRRTTGNLAIRVQAQPGHDDWARVAGDHAVLAVGALADWTGAPWPTDELLVRRTEQPGPIDDHDAAAPAGDVVALGAEFDPADWTRRLVAARFRDEFAEQWLRVGVAEVVTTMLADQLDLPDLPPAPAAPPATGEGLLAWEEAGVSVSGDDDVDGSDQRRRTRAIAVVAGIASEIGERRFRTIVRHSLAERSAWGPLATPATTEAADWREFLDLAERVGGASRARDLVLAHVAPGSEREVRRHDRLVRRWEELAEDPWGPPAAVTDHVHHWRLDDADDTVAGVQRVRADLRPHLDRAGRLGVTLHGVRRAWRTGSLPDLEAHAAVVEDLLDEIEALRDGATAVDVPMPATTVVSTTRDPAAQVLVVRSLRGAVDRLAAAERALESVPHDPVTAIGMLGGDPEGLRLAARDALARGDVGVASTATRGLDELVSDATVRGWARLAVALAGLFALAALAGTTLAWWRGRRPTDPGTSVAASAREERAAPLGPPGARGHVDWSRVVDPATAAAVTASRRADPTERPLSAAEAAALTQAFPGTFSAGDHLGLADLERFEDEVEPSEWPEWLRRERRPQEHDAEGDLAPSATTIARPPPPPPPPPA